ncbi:MAG: hypothetical protein GYB65_06710 [Chloroflexi bacterium]|nr:hypothetical protein [Chloroflexota bacterium]
MKRLIALFVLAVLVVAALGIAPQTAQAELPVTFYGTLDYDSHPYDDYPIYIEAGQPITITLDCGPPKPGPLDPMLLVYDPDGMPFAGSDDAIGDDLCGGYSGGIVSFLAPVTGWYTVRATSYAYWDGYDWGTGDGPYTLMIEGVFTGVPGCDQLVLPPNAAGGQMLATTTAYWAPGEITDPPVDLALGTTAIVLGLDDTGEYYQIAFACDYLWVPVDTIGPNPDAVWNGAALPTDVVNFSK